MYGNDREAGLAIKTFITNSNGLVKRQDLWITTKLSDNMGNAITTTKEIIERLDCQYLDLLLLHCPIEFQLDKTPNLPKLDVIWRNLESLVDEGIVKNIGLFIKILNIIIIS